MKIKRERTENLNLHTTLASFSFNFDRTNKEIQK